MRIRRLDLLRYGRFTGASLDLPRRERDIHILFGPNEAGKSTTLSAIEEMLFGIAPASPLNFLHTYPSMRVGAVLEAGGQTLEFRRRKGRKDTLLGPDDLPLREGEAALAPYLAGADLRFFTRMFCLDYERLRQGGREILEAQDEAGQTLFSAGAGLAGLRERLKELDDEADSLWGPRRSLRRKYTQAEDHFREAEAALRERTVTASKWLELKRAHQSACEGYQAVEREIERLSAEQRKLSRLRRVYRNVCAKLELDAQIAALGEAPLLPGDAGRRLEAAERAEAGAAARIETLAERLAAERKARAALACDEALLRCADDIRGLHERRIQLRAARAELPRLQAELESAEAGLRRLAGEFGWEGQGVEWLAARMPPRSKAAALRSLLNRRGEALAALEGARAALEEAEARSAGLARQIEALGRPVDASMLAAVIAVCREKSGLVSRTAMAAAEAEEAEAAADRKLRVLKPAAASGEELAAMPVPAREAVQTFRDSRRELEQRAAANRERAAAAGRELEARRRALQRLTREGKAVSSEELAQARGRRDGMWSVLRRSLAEGEPAPEERVDGYEAGVREADSLADRRFEYAKEAASLVQISNQIAELEDAAEGLAQETRRLAGEGAALDEMWAAMWSGSGVSPLPPDAMLEWLTARVEVLALTGRAFESRRRAEALRAEEVQARESLLEALRGVDEGGALAEQLESQALPVAVERASDFLRACGQDAANRRRLEESLAQSAAEIQAKRRALDKAERAWSEWGGMWAAAVEACGFSGAVEVGTAAAQLDALDEMRQMTAAVAELGGRRIAGVEREEAAFAAETEKLLLAVAPGLAGSGADASVMELERRLAEAERIDGLIKEKSEAAAALETLVEEAEKARREAREVIRSLQELAGADGVEALRSAVSRSDRLRELRRTLVSVNEALLQDGDGLPLSELQDACRGVDLDQIAAREEALDGELNDLRARLMEAQQRRVQARREFEAIGGADAAARAAAERQEALAEIAGTAAQYIRARASALLLRWAIDRYRREKQAPLLRSAGECFARLTNGSFTGLQLEFDEQDRAHIAGVRPGGALVRDRAMSAGAADQLYLALRLAAVEDYLERAKALPFVADDLFINFDDERSGAGFEVLGRLARRTQVLFFTHHGRLVEIARARLGADVPVIYL
jgi:uncharacterized protein YhaN